MFNDYMQILSRSAICKSSGRRFDSQVDEEPEFVPRAEQLVISSCHVLGVLHKYAKNVNAGRCLKAVAKINRYNYKLFGGKLSRPKRKVSTIIPSARFQTRPLLNRFAEGFYELVSLVASH